MGPGKKLFFSSESTNLHLSLGKVGLELSESRHDSNVFKFVLESRLWSGPRSNVGYFETYPACVFSTSPGYILFIPVFDAGNCFFTRGKE